MPTLSWMRDGVATMGDDLEIAVAVVFHPEVTLFCGVTCALRVDHLPTFSDYLSEWRLSYRDGMAFGQPAAGEDGKKYRSIIGKSPAFNEKGKERQVRTHLPCSLWYGRLQSHPLPE